MADAEVIEQRRLNRPEWLAIQCGADPVFELGVSFYEDGIEECPIVCPTSLRERWSSGYLAAQRANLPR